MIINKRFIAIDNVCAWPQIRKNRDEAIFMTGFNKPCHGKIEGDVDCWVSYDKGEFFTYTGTPVLHNPATNRMNHCSGFAHNGDFLVIVSGYTNRPKDKIYEGDEYYTKIFSKSKTLVPVIARSTDEGKTFSNSPLQFESNASIIPYGEIIKLDNNALMCSVYLVGTKETISFVKGDRQAGVLISYDDGLTWDDYYIIDEGLNETSIANLGEKLIAVSRTANNQHLVLYSSINNGKTWQYQQDISLLNQIPASITILKDKRVLITYGCRNNIKSISYRIGDQYAKNFEEPTVLQIIGTDSDMGYPSTIQLNDDTLVTAYYTSKDVNHDRYHVGIIKWSL